MSGKPIDEAVERARQCIVMLRQHLALFVQDDVAQAMFRDADEVVAALTAAQQQGQESGGEVFGWVLGNAFVDARFWTGDTPPQGWTPVYCTAPPSAPVGEVCIRLNGIGEGGPYPVVNGVCVLPQSVAENLVASAVGQQVKRELLAQWASYKQPAAPSATVGVDEVAWRDAFIAERARRYRSEGMKIEQARIHAETDADLTTARTAQQPAADPLEEWANRPLNFTATVGKFEDGVVGKQPAAVDEAVRLLREYREAPKFSNDHDAIKRTVALEDEIDAFLAAITTYEQEGKESFWPKLPGSGGPDWTGHD